jgi:outer membrane protein assembly factor BamB
MKTFLRAFFCILITTSAINAENSTASDWHEDPLIVEADLLYVVSSFEDLDYFSAFTHAGEFSWEAPFSTEILSWKFLDDHLFLFSHARDGSVYYLTCLDAKTGKLLWEKGVYKNVGPMKPS